MTLKKSTFFFGNFIFYISQFLIIAFKTFTQMKILHDMYY